MNVLLVSQCDKRALKESRRILDQFAERRGERTWQTPITQVGLNTLRKLLRRTARKNTAVACHWIRGRDHSELLWIVGNASRFNSEGAVPTNTTRRNILRQESENNWHTAEDIKLLAGLAAFMHDLGKMSVAFQQRLTGDRIERNLYRHEWVSLRLFQAFVGSDSDDAWLARLSDPSLQSEDDWLAREKYHRDGLDDCDQFPFRHLPPVAQAIAWLILTHHRLPQAPVFKNDSQLHLGARSKAEFSWDWIKAPLESVAHDWNEIKQTASQDDIKPYWQPAVSLPTVDPDWQRAVARLAKKLRAMIHKRDADWLSNPYVMHLARLSLMLSDHHYSSLKFDENDQPVYERQRFLQTGATVFANTCRKSSGDFDTNQSLTEHLLGVGDGAMKIAQALPGFERYLPLLKNHRGLRKRTTNKRFSWQDKAFDAACAIRKTANDSGAFIVNMASTGCGKTLANARILYGLSEPEIGLRATYALGLRTLTLQTGRSYRRDLHLNDDELAVLVGGLASRDLFEYYEAKAESTGSASIQDLLEEDSHVLYEGHTADHPLLSRALANPKIKNLLSAPMLVCTVDHITPATEAVRAGRQIAPMLRLMSSDLILDELDDYDLNDMPALTRLVYWSGLLGSRIVLSSATLPPTLVKGLFSAYRAGRTEYQRNRGSVGVNNCSIAEIPCIWTDEFGTRTSECVDGEQFSVSHQKFLQKRSTKLSTAAVLRRGELLPLNISEKRPQKIRQAFAVKVKEACLRLHNDHAHIDPKTEKRVSFGIVRMANIDRIIDVARALHALGGDEQTHIHLCVYHSRFPQAQRSAIEFMLDQAFDRRVDGGKAVFQVPAIRSLLDKHQETNQIFIVLASPVCEVGRDWDADWAVAEPSSMRSLIQLAGRIMRHRLIEVMKPNLLIFETNLKRFEDGSKAIFNRPGFEEDSREQFRLNSHSLSELLAPVEFETISALPRIQPRPTENQRPQDRFVDLEHARIDNAMSAIETPKLQSRRNPAPPLQRDQAAAAWQFPRAMLSGVLAQQQPFREQTMKTLTVAFLPNDDEDELKLKRVQDDRAKFNQKLYVDVEYQCHEMTIDQKPGLSHWGAHDLLAILRDHADQLDLSLKSCAERMATAEIVDNESGWRWHPWLGFGLAK